DAAGALFAESLELARRMGTKRPTAYALLGLALAGCGGARPGRAAPPPRAGPPAPPGVGPPPPPPEEAPPRRPRPPPHAPGAARPSTPNTPPAALSTRPRCSMRAAAGRSARLRGQPNRALPGPVRPRRC